MEISKSEIQAIQKVATDGANNFELELSDLELAVVGGGGGDVVIF